MKIWVLRITQAWYRGHFLLQWLRPLSWLYQWIAAQKKNRALKSQAKLPVPVIVIGNIAVGGTGKTPLAIHLVRLLKQAGYQPGIVSRGYGGKSDTYPRAVTPDSSHASVGDEPVLLAKRTGVPIMVDPNRTRAARELIKQYQCNVLICDDGMQHYALARDIEIAVIDGARRFGNGMCLPAGPLREPVSRLKQVDFIVVNGAQVGEGEFGMRLVPNQVVNLNDPSQQRAVQDFHQGHVHVVAGIGNPQRFFDKLTRLGLDIIPHAFPDHYPYKHTDFDFSDDAPVIMTEKDMVRCATFAQDHWWYLPVETEVDAGFDEALLKKLKEVKDSE